MYDKIVAMPNSTWQKLVVTPKNNNDTPLHVWFTQNKTINQKEMVDQLLKELNETNFEIIENLKVNTDELKTTVMIQNEDLSDVIPIEVTYLKRVILEPNGITIYELRSNIEAENNYDRFFLFIYESVGTKLFATKSYYIVETLNKNNSADKPDREQRILNNEETNTKIQLTAEISEDLQNNSQQWIQYKEASKFLIPFAGYHQGGAIND